MKLQISLAIILVTILLLGACSAQPATPLSASTGMQATTTSQPPAASKPVEMNIFAAASLADAFNDIGKVFEAEHPGVKVVFNLAGSQQLAQQIIAGAPADVFASANMTQMGKVIEGGEIVSGTQQVFANNWLVVITPKDNPGGIKELKDLANPGIKVILAAKEVPVGAYSLEFLNKAAADPAFGEKYKQDVLGNVVSYEENVKTVLTKVVLGEADAGIVYSSDIAGADAGKSLQLAIPKTLNVMAAYSIAKIKDSPNPEQAQAFIDLVLSTKGQEILAKYNFIRVR